MSAPAISGDCAECGGQRITLNWVNCLILPCSMCEPSAYAAFMARVTTHDTEPCPPPPETLPAPPIICPYSRELADPWDLASEELVQTADLRERQYLGDRADHDPVDDKSDVQPHERLTSYPWGSK